ncbi:MAG: polyhydroxyalkanoate synthesis repressor PhaR [Hyphomicrobiaceae bacterium]
MDQTKKPVTIKKYANRRLYNTETSTYVTLDDLAEMVRQERDFVVYDAKTGEDLTHSVLTQIILERESRGQTLLPVSFLRQLIRFYGDSVGKLVPSYLAMSLDALTQQQEKFRKQMTDAFGSGPFTGNPFGQVPFGSAAFEAMQEQAKQNMAMFEKAFTMFTPFGQMGRMAAGGTNGRAEDKAPDVAKESSEAPADARNELGELRDQLAAMQRQLDKLSKNDR